MRNAELRAGTEGILTAPGNDSHGRHQPDWSRSRGVLPPFKDLASDYDRWFDSEGRSVFLTELRALRELSAHMPRPWLEIGVGSGRFAQALGIEAGVDPSVEMVALARTRGVNAILGRGEQRLFEEESFGTVFMITTLCFLGSPRSVLKETHRLLVPGGKVLLGLVLREGPWGQFYEKKKAMGHRFYRYATFYTFDEVEGLLARTGFTVERVASTLFAQPGTVQHTEEPRDGYCPDAGFTVVAAGRQSLRSKRRRQVA